MVGSRINTSNAITVDVADPKVQSFMLSELAGIDGRKIAFVLRGAHRI